MNARGSERMESDSLRLSVSPPLRLEATERPSARETKRKDAAKAIHRMRARRSRRRGAAVVEMALVTPLLMMMILGVMEFGWVMMVRETLVNATREACRVRVLDGATDADAQARFAAAVAPTNLAISPGMVSITFDAATSAFTVTATVPRQQASLTGVGEFLQRIIPGFLSGNIVVSSSMRQETKIT